MAYIKSMITTVTQKNMVSIPAEIWKKLGIRPGYKLDWHALEGKDEILVKVLPDRAELAKRLKGLGASLVSGSDLAAELDAERELEG